MTTGLWRFAIVFNAIKSWLDFRQKILKKTKNDLLYYCFKGKCSKLSAVVVITMKSRCLSRNAIVIIVVVVGAANKYFVKSEKIKIR